MDAEKLVLSRVQLPKKLVQNLTLFPVYIKQQKSTKGTTQTFCKNINGGSYFKLFKNPTKRFEKQVVFILFTDYGRQN